LEGFHAPGISSVPLHVHLLALTAEKPLEAEDSQSQNLASESLENQGL
jgi:hypothetical protein